jgi:UDP-3-O-acyl-N-acetylglucosamine deacetylase
MFFSNPERGRNQYTLAAPVDYSGAGLLGGKRVSMTLLPKRGRYPDLHGAR